MTRTDEELQQVADEVGQEIVQAFSGPKSPAVTRVDHLEYTDSGGRRAIRFTVVLADPSRGGTHSFEKLKPIRAFIEERLRYRNVDDAHYVGFMLASEDVKIRAGTCYKEEA